MGATAAPSVCAANSPIIISGELWATKATTSPRFTPSEASPAATARRRRRQTVRRDARTVEMGGDRRRTKGVYAFDYGDTVGITPIVKMHTLGHDFMPPGIHAGGLRYHGAAPLVSRLLHDGVIEAVAYPQRACFEAAVTFSRTEGIIPPPESSHAVKAAIDEAKKADAEGKSRGILFNLSRPG